MKINTKLSPIILFAVILSFLPTRVFAQIPVDPAFNPGLLITDEQFGDVGTFGTAEGVQRFLEMKSSVLANTSADFLAKLKEPDVATKTALEDPQPNLTRFRTAAELIYDAATSKGLNPQVLLVLLQKEQGLIANQFNSDSNLQRALDRAVGFGCPDYEGCGDIFLGFYRQLFGSFDSNGSRWLGASASLMKSFRFEVSGVRVGRGPMIDSQSRVYGRPVVRTSRVGDTIILDNTMGAFENIFSTQSVTIQNFATAALYRYTPHVFNGNYNFWKFFTTWFRYPNGTVIQRTDDTALYVIDNGSKRPFSSFVAQQRGIKSDVVITVSQSEFDSYITEKPLTPKDGTLIKGDVSAAVYLIEDSTRRPISGPVFVQKKYKFSDVITIPQAEVDTYGLGVYVTPNEGTLVTGDVNKTVYLISAGLKQPISYDVFMARKLSFAKVMKLSDDEVTNFSLGPYLAPPDKVAIKSSGDATIYWFRDNQKRSVSAYVYNQRGVKYFPHLTLSDEEMASIVTATPFPPTDGTVIKGDVSSAIYKMDKGLKRMFTAASYKKARYPKATVLPQVEVDGYAEGEVIK